MHWAGMDSVLRQNCVVRVNYGSSMEKAKQFAALWKRLGEILGRNLEEAGGKFRPSFNSPSISNKI